MPRQNDLEKHLLDIYGRVLEHEQRLQILERPGARLRSQHELDRLRVLARDNLDEYRAIVDGTLPDDMAAIAAHMAVPPPDPTPVDEQMLPPVDALCRLPSSPANFTGRDKELARMWSRIGKNIVAICGMDGIGKRSLALVLAGQLSARYPDAQILIDLGGRSSDPLTTTEAMTRIIHALQPTVRVPDVIPAVIPSTTVSSTTVSSKTVSFAAVEPGADNPGQEPGVHAELHDLYRRVFNGRRALLVLDNAVDGAQVAPLVPLPGNGMIVTSRNEITLPGMYTTNLDALPQAQARALLLKIAPHLGQRLSGRLSSRISGLDDDGEGAGASELIGLCGCLPLVLRLAGSALAERRHLVPGDYLQCLDDAQVCFDLVDAALSLSYEQLDKKVQRLFCLLAVFPGSFDRSAAAAVWDVEPEPEASRVLDELVRFGLLIPDLASTVHSASTAHPASVRYAMHDYCRRFARARLDAAADPQQDDRDAGAAASGSIREVDARTGDDKPEPFSVQAQLDADSLLTENDRLCAQRRHAAYYETVVRTANRLFMRSGAAPLRGLALFDVEWHNIRAGQDWAYALAMLDRRALELCDDYVTTGFEILAFRLPAERRMVWLETALYAARLLGRRRSQRRHLSSLGEIYARLGRVNGKDSQPGAIDCYRQALDISRAVGDRIGEGDMLGRLGDVCWRLGRIDGSDAQPGAIAYYTRALDIAREFGDRRVEGEMLGNLGNAYRRLGRIDGDDEQPSAIACYTQALVIACELGDRSDEGTYLSNLGNAYYALGQIEVADVEPAGTDPGDLYRPGQAVADRYQAGALHRPGTLHQASATHSLGAVYSGDDVYMLHRLTSQDVIAMPERRQDEPRQPLSAIACYTRALAIARETGDRRAEGNRLGNLGIACAALGRTEQAIEYYTRSLTIAREIGDRRNEGVRLGNLGNACAKLGQVGKAIVHFTQALAIARATGDRRAETTHLGNLGNAYRTLGQFEASIAPESVAGGDASETQLGAIEYYTQALAVAREIGDRRTEATHLGNLGNVCAAVGRIETSKVAPGAIDYLTEAAEIFEAIDDPRAAQAQEQLAQLRAAEQSKRNALLAWLVGRRGR